MPVSSTSEGKQGNFPSKRIANNPTMKQTTRKESGSNDLQHQWQGNSNQCQPIRTSLVWGGCGDCGFGQPKPFPCHSHLLVSSPFDNSSLGVHLGEHLNPLKQTTTHPYPFPCPRSIFGVGATESFPVWKSQNPPEAFGLLVLGIGVSLRLWTVAGNTRKRGEMDKWVILLGSAGPMAKPLTTPSPFVSVP